MSRLLMKNQLAGVYLSENGWRAAKRGELPACLIEDIKQWEPTIPHHIQRPLRTIIKNNYSRELVMFYRPKDKFT